MVDRELILRKLADLDQYLVQVGEYRNISAPQYRDDWKTQRIVERTLQIAIELCVDIANQIIADRGLRVPTTYAEVFEVLGEAGMLPPSHRDAMIRMSGFRNVIVHEYSRIDPALVVRVLHEQLDDFAQFKAAVLEWI